MLNLFSQDLGSHFLNNIATDDTNTQDFVFAILFRIRYET